MSVTTLLEEEKEGLLNAVRREKTPAAVRPLLEKTWDRLQLKYLEECGSDSMRALGVYLIQTAKASCGFAGMSGEAQIWEKSTAEQKQKKISTPGVIVCAAALLLMAASLLVLFAKDPDVILKNSALKVGGSLFVLSLTAFFLGGFLIRKMPRKAGRELRADETVDPEKCWRAMHTAALMIDRQIEDASAEEKAERKKAMAEKQAAFTKEETELYAGLLEAKYSGDGEYALDRLEDLRYFLHQKGLEVVDLDEAHKEWFDYMPGEKAGTIRPAIAFGGKLLKKGLASGDF